MPELRTPGAVRNFNQALAQCDYDLEEWRATKVGREFARCPAGKKKTVFWGMQILSSRPKYGVSDACSVSQGRACCQW